jgi:hypothetical protein
MVAMATVYLAEEYRREFSRLFAEWQRSRGSKSFFVPPEGRSTDGKLAYTMVPDEFVQYLRLKRIPFSSPSN